MRYIENTDSAKEFAAITLSFEHFRENLEQIRVQPSSADLKDFIKGSRSVLAGLAEALRDHFDWLDGRSLCIHTDLWESLQSPKAVDGQLSLMTRLWDTEDHDELRVAMDYRQLSKAFSISDDSGFFAAMTQVMLTPAGEDAAHAIAKYFYVLKGGRVNELLEARNRGDG